MRLRTAAAVLLVTAPVLAGVPDKGDGTVTVLGGLRAIPGGEYQSETGAKHSLWHPGVLVGFGFQLDDELHVGIQLGYGLDQYGTGSSAMKVRSIQILLAMDTALAQGNWYTIYGGGGLGYSLNTISQASGDVEANSGLGFVALGVRFRISDHFGAVIEDRYNVSSAAGDPSATNTINMGGNLLSVGFIFHFFSPEDKGHPTAPVR